MQRAEIQLSTSCWALLENLRTFKLTLAHVFLDWVTGVSKHPNSLTPDPSSGEWLESVP